MITSFFITLKLNSHFRTLLPLLCHHFHIIFFHQETITSLLIYSCKISRLLNTFKKLILGNFLEAKKLFKRCNYNSTVTPLYETCRAILYRIPETFKAFY